MQVNKDRFPAVLPHFLSLLETCEFYAFDEEMTGINVPEITENITFSPEESYQSKRLAASRYSMIQVGICLFHRDEEAEQQKGNASQQRCYVARPFNFILFPNWTDELAQLQPPPSTAGEASSAAASAPRGVNADVVLSPSALSFLRKHGMNFQEWVYQGISLCDRHGEQLLRRHLAEKRRASGDAADADGAEAEVVKEDPTDLPIFFTDEENAWVTDAIRTARDLVKRVAAAEEEEEEAQNREPGASLPLSREVMLPPQASRSARDHLRAYAKRFLPTLSVSFRRQGSSSGLTSTTLTALTAAEAMRKTDKEARVRARELVDLLGFRLVFEALVASKKPCVGHNCFADVCFLMAALDQPLPETLAAWKARTAELFPAFFDTKYVASRRDLFPAGRFPAHYLGGLFEQYGFSSPQVRVRVPVGFEAYDPISLLGSNSRGNGGGGGGGPAHEAAFDAFMTGTLLLNLLAECGALEAAGGSLARVAPDLANKVALFRSLYAVDLAQATKDEYVPDVASSVVLDVQHDPSVKSAQLEGLLQSVATESSGAVATPMATAPPPIVQLYSVDNVSRTLAVLGRARRAAPPPDAAALAEKLTQRYPAVFRQVTPYTPPHAKLRATTFAFPSAKTVEKTLLRSVLPRK